MYNYELNQVNIISLPEPQYCEPCLPIMTGLVVTMKINGKNIIVGRLNNGIIPIDYVKQERLIDKYQEEEPELCIFENNVHFIAALRAERFTTDKKGFLKNNKRVYVKVYH